MSELSTKQSAGWKLKRTAVKFLLMFEDQDRGMSIYDEEGPAREAFAKAESRGWNCHLFGLLRRASEPPDGAP